MGSDFLRQVVGDSNNDNVVYEFVLVEDLLDPATATEDVPESRLLHVGVMIKNYKRKRLLDHVRPDFAHVVVIPVVKKMDSACIRDARVSNSLADGLDRFVVAVAVRAGNTGAVHPPNFCALVRGTLRAFTQPLHKGLAVIDARKVLNRDIHAKKNKKSPVPKDRALLSLV